jgi:hypothetical protein
MMPPAAIPEGVLVVACALLHNSLGPGASPEATEQWHNDVDHLIITTMNTPPHRRLRAHHLIGGRSGEDDRTTIERWCERRRNLEDDYNTTNASPTGHATHSPCPQENRGGCVVLVPHIQMVVWPPKFWPHLPKKYDETINPVEFLQIYTTSILTAGGNEAIMANYFPVALIDTA